MPFHQSSLGRGAIGQIGQQLPGFLSGLLGSRRREPKRMKPTRADKARVLRSQGPVRSPAQLAPEFFPVRRPPLRSLTARPTAFSAAEKNRGREFKFPELGFANGKNGAGDCPAGTVPDPRGFCVSPISPLGAATLGGEAVMGQHGAAVVPGSMIIDRAVCGRGMQLGDDGLCYNKSQISNKERMWPAGRKPLLTGGDMRAIGTAARAGRRLEGATKRLQRLGLMKKPAPRRNGRPARGRALVLKEAGPGGITVQ